MTIAMLGLIAFTVSSTVILFQVTRGRLFTLLTFYSALFLVESSGGALKALLPDQFPEVMITPYSAAAWVPKALAVSISGYLLFLYGYALASWLAGHPRQQLKDAATEGYFDRCWKAPYKLLLMGVTLFAILAGFVQHLGRIRMAGGLLPFIRNAYTYRFGIATETAGETMAVVLANLIAASAVPLMLIWVIAWLRGRLGTLDKIVVTLLLLLLMARQWATMFRAVLIFTLVAFFATYLSERQVKIRRLFVIAVVVLVVAIGVNFVHYYLYFLTAGWEEPQFLGSIEQLLTPHGHIATLALVLSKADSTTTRLGGQGFVESAFFFVPRAIWETKTETTQTGTLLVQDWADLPTHYQMAVTAVGEWVAHFGLAGIAGMVLFGALYGVFDTASGHGPLARAALYGLLISRVLADSGMGIASLSVTVFCLMVFWVEIAFVHVTIWASALLIGIPRFFLSVAPARTKVRRRSPVPHA